jgi:hypothetical protein
MAAVVEEEEEGKKKERRGSNDDNKNETQDEINSNTIVVSDSVNRGTEGKLPACQPGQRTPPSSLPSSSNRPMPCRPTFPLSAKW